MRETTEALRGRLRVLIGDPSEGAHFSEDDLEAFLDDHRTRRAYEALTYRIEPDGNFVEFSGPAHFEAGAVLYDSSYGVIAAEGYTADEYRGVWTFDAPGLADPAVFVHGTSFDLKAAAADALRAWAASLKLEYDVSVSGDSYSRSQKVAQMLELADRYEEESGSEGAGGGLTTIRQVRTDHVSTRRSRDRRL